jgi:chemotaxis response regulator CheB
MAVTGCGTGGFAAVSGASLKDLMERMGHSSTHAALIYQHTSAEHSRLIAAGISKLADAERDRSSRAQPI